MGTPRAILPQGDEVHFQTDTTLLLLAQLGLNPNRVFCRADLAALFYPDHDDRRAGQNLRQTIHRLRQLLGEDDRAEPALLVKPQTICVNPDGPLVTDIVQFNAGYQAALQSAHTHAHRRLEVCQTCMDQLEAVAELSTGEFLDGIAPPPDSPLEDWVCQVRREHAAQLIWIQHRLAQHFFERGLYDRSEYYLLRLLGADALDEAALRLQMRLLALTGRRNQALTLYNETLRQLQRALDLLPEEETILLAQMIRAGEVGRPSPQPPALVTRQSLSGEWLPDTTLPFVGRARELAQLQTWLESQQHRILVIQGLVGSGKTRLAFQAASHDRSAWADGVHWVLLSRADSLPPTLAAALVQALGVPSRNSSEHRKHLAGFLRDKECLIVIDNFDELSDQGDLLPWLLTQCPRIKFLVTARRHPRLRGAQILSLAGLDYPATPAPAGLTGADLETYLGRHSALLFFRDVARRVKPAFEITAADLPSLLQICEMLVGLPLGLELAAAYVRFFTCAELCAGLRACLSGDSAAPSLLADRHGLFRRSFAAIWEGLTPVERDLMKHLYRYPEGVPAETLWAAQGAAPDALLTLQDKSAVVRRPDGRIALHPLARVCVPA